ncbi:MAG: SDR family oxidoreductase [Planctomycetota bacterium]
MELGLEGRAVLVTGASGGIGREIAAALGAEGAVPVLQARAGAAALGSWVATQAWGARARVFTADVRDAAGFEAALEGCLGDLELFGCVACAGIWPADDTPLVDLDEARVRDVIETNLLGAMWTSRAFLRRVRAQGAVPGAGLAAGLAAGPATGLASEDVGRHPGPALVLIGSTAATFGEAGHSDYAASKAALEGLVRSLKNEIVALDPYGRVNVVHPGWTVTEMTRANLDAPGVVEGVLRTLPLEQLASPADVANAVLWLLSPRVSRHVSGEALTVAGGMEGRVLRAPGEVDVARVRARLDARS